MNAFQMHETTMTPEEAEAVVRRHLERVPETPSGPSLSEMAEVLKVSPEEVASLLAEVRHESRRKPKRKITRRERRVWLLSGAIALAIGGVGLGVAKNTRVGPFRPTYTPAISTQSGDAYHVYMEGSDLGEMHWRPQFGPAEDVLPGSVERLMQQRAAQLGRQVAPSDQVVDETRRAVAEGRWDNAPGIRLTTMEIRKGGYGNAMRWARTTVPVYLGDDLLVAEAVAKERSRRMGEAVKEALKGLPVVSTSP